MRRGFRRTFPLNEVRGALKKRNAPTGVSRPAALGKCEDRTRQLRTNLVLKLSLLHLLHRIVRRAGSEGHVCDRRVLAAGRNHERSIGDK